MTDPTEINFDGWIVRVRSGELLHDGQTQRLPQQPLRVLLELLAQPGQVVTRERLVQVLWPKGVVDFDNNLNSIVRKLRVALEDDSETPRYIETLPRIDYRFWDHFDARLGYLFIAGSQNSVVGQYKDNDEVFFWLRYLL